MRHTAPVEIFNRATFDTGARGISHGAAWISCRRAARRSVSEKRSAEKRSRDTGTGILFELSEKIMMNEVARLERARIVLIEDDLESRESLRMLLQEEGAEVIAVADAEEGAETVIRELPDAVICDIDLPMMDGFYLIQRLRDHEIRGNLTPSIAIALTGHDGDEYRLRSIGEGFHHFMTKPAHPDALVTLIQQSLSSRELS
jgi:two-component system, cell cycle response regulator CtrA